MDATRERVVEMSFNDAGLDLETVFQAQYERISRIIAGVIRDPARAEELAVEVFLKWERTPKAQGEGTEGWLYRTAVRSALNELRRQTLRRRHERLLGFLTRGRTGGSTPHEIYAAQEEQERVLRTRVHHAAVWRRFSGSTASMVRCDRADAQAAAADRDSGGSGRISQFSPRD